jgi:predicted transposase YbfD/YdcC
LRIKEAVVEQILLILGEVEDPRAANAEHRLLDILVIALFASLCGAKTGVEMAAFGKAREAFLRQFLALPHGIPSHDTFSRLFRLLAPAALERLLRRVAAAMGQAAGGALALDGKSLRRGYEKGQAHAPPMTVSVFAAKTRLTLAHGVAEGGNEVEAVLAALKLVDVKGCTVTADALHCHAEMARRVHQAGGDYVLCLKRGQSKLHAEVEAACANANPRLAIAGTSDDGHGRQEERECIVVPFKQTGKRNRFPGLKACARIVSERTQQVRTRIKGESLCKTVTTTATRYYLLSRRLAPAEVLDVVRQHWGIENRLHWRLDMVFDEDRARTRKDHAPANLALLRRLTMNILQSHPSKASINVKRQTAGWNEQFFFELFAHMR